VVFKLIISLFRASKIARAFKPDVVIGVGGYASGPMLRMAAFHKIPTLIQEQNSFAGVTNRLLADKAARICVAYTGMDKYFPIEKIVITGNPTREELVNQSISRSSACAFFGIPEGNPVLLVLGGSLGARTINESILARVDDFEKEDVSVLWQTGRLYFEGIRQELDTRQLKHVQYFDFIDRMDMAYSVADIIVSRAGAATISELCLLGKPVILVPSPNVAEDHQTKNALALVGNNAAIMITDKEAREKLVAQALELLQNSSLRATLGSNCKQMALAGSATKIVNEIFNLAEKR